VKPFAPARELLLSPVAADSTLRCGPIAPFVA